MKIAIIADIHHDVSPGSAFDVRPVVEAFVDRANGTAVDLLIDLGDRIDDVDRNTDFAAAADLADIFSRFRGPRVHLLGNHDVVNLTSDDHHRLFGQQPTHQVLDLDDARVIVWQPSVRFDRKLGFPPAAPDLDWLLDSLNADHRPAIVATHIPVSGASMAGNYYFENNSDFATYPDHARIRRAVEETGRASLWMAGHVHWNSFAAIGGVRHLTIQSPSERFTTNPDPACTFAEISSTGDTARLEIFGRDRLAIDLPFGASGAQSWLPPRPRVERS